MILLLYGESGFYSEDRLMGRRKNYKKHRSAFEATIMLPIIAQSEVGNAVF